MRHLARTIQRFVRRQQAKEKARVAPRAFHEPKPVKRIATTYQSAATSLVDRKAIATSDYSKKILQTPRAHCHPDLVEFELKFRRTWEATGIPLYAFEFFRSHERQATLLRQGVTKAGPGSSPHQWGCAVDIVSATRYWDLTRKEWGVIGAMGKEVARRMNIKVEWGGDWSFYDPAHWELAEWRETRSTILTLCQTQTGFPGTPEDIPKGQESLYFGEVDHVRKEARKKK